MTPPPTPTWTTHDDSPAIDGEFVEVDVPPEVADSGIHVGDTLRVLRIQDPEQADVDDEGDLPQGGTDEDAGANATGDTVPLSYFDHDRGRCLWGCCSSCMSWWWRWWRVAAVCAVVGLAAGIAIVVWFMLPALFTGQNALLVAIVASSAMIFPSVYIAHGISIRSTTALLGTFAGIALTAAIGALLAGVAPARNRSHGRRRAA